LTEFFIDRYARRYNRPARQLSEQLAQLFLSYEWPGNIRGLENMIKRIVILQDESLVVREMTRTLRPARAFATAGVGAMAPASPIATADEPEEVEVVDEEPPAEESVPASAPLGSRLADVAKAA